MMMMMMVVVVVAAFVAAISAVATGRAMERVYAYVDRWMKRTRVGCMCVRLVHDSCKVEI